MSRVPFRFVSSLPPLPFVLSLSKDASGRDAHSDRLSANGFSHSEMLS